jgi:hypothetical protein
LSANPQNLKIPTSEEARRNGAKGGRASVEARKKKKLLRECLQELMQMEYNTSQGKKSGSEMLSAMLMKKAMSGDIKAFEVLRDTAGEKPVDKVMVADVDKSVIDEVEKMVNDTGASC